jgi:Domain of unknown function (DUF4412)
MKKLLLLAPLFLLPCLGHADLVIMENIDSAMVSGPTTLKIKGDLARVDSPMPGGLGSATTIIDTAKGKSTILMNAQKMAMEMDLAGVMKQAQAAAGTVEKPKATGQSEKVGDWNADIYEVTVGAMPIRLWVAKDFPNAAAVKAQMNKLSKIISGGLDLSKFDIPGLAVKTEITMPQGKMTTTIVSVKDTPVADSEFVVPTDYKKMSAPGGLGGQ